MIVRRPSLGLPRKVVSYYLLFCLVAITWLSVGVLSTTHSVLKSQHVNSCLSKLDKLSAAIELEYLRNGMQNLQSLLARAKTESRFDYCAIVSNEGTYCSHTKTDQIGLKATEYGGTPLQWENLKGIRYADSRGAYVSEYRLPLVADNLPIGTLHIGLVEPNWWQTLAEMASVVPVVVIIPLVVVGLGGLVISRITRPIGEISKQLQHIAALAPGTSEELSPIRVHDAISLGWNRLVTLLDRQKNDTGRLSLEEKLLKASTERRSNQHRDILESIPDGVAMTDVEGRITFANRAVAALLGEGATEGAAIADLLTEIDEKSKQWVHTPSDNLASVCEIHRQGNLSERVIRISRQGSNSSNRPGQIWCLRDVTQQKLSEKMRDQFIDTATHELRTPLSNIKAYAETLVTGETIDVEQQKEFCNIINSEVTRLARFVDDLLSISSMEMGSLTIDRKTVETARLFAEVFNKVEPLMQQKHITFVKELPEKLSEIKLDKDKIIAVLVNLLGNAAKYTPVGGRVTFRVTLDQKALEFAVEDTGVGIAAEELPKVFDKFFRSADERVQEESGTGLGLSLAKEVVEMHGGEISVESVLNQGSTFTVSIPLEGVS